MGKKKSKGLNAKELWSSKPEPKTMTADDSLDIILGSVQRLPLNYWRRNFFFFNAGDEEILELTSGKFPAKLIKGKKHPVLSLKSLPGNVGFRVCPCSSNKPFNSKFFRYIAEGCRLQHTGYTMDRHSFLIEKVSFNIPPSIAYTLRFKGEVPAECLKSASLKPVTNRNNRKNRKNKIPSR